MARPASYSVEKDKTNPKLKDGDTVFLTEDMDVETGRGVITILPAGTEGVVVDARTPKVRQLPGTSPYFANVDCNIGNCVVRVRPYHYQLRRRN